MWLVPVAAARMSFRFGAALMISGVMGTLLVMMISALVTLSAASVGVEVGWDVRLPSSWSGERSVSPSVEASRKVITMLASGVISLLGE